MDLRLIEFVLGVLHRVARAHESDVGGGGGGDREEFSPAETAEEE